jgi:hypothetical protein
MTVRLSARELATVLAALRSWQQSLALRDVQITADHFDPSITPLSKAEIDDLYERLDFAEAP